MGATSSNKQQRIQTRQAPYNYGWTANKQDTTKPCHLFKSPVYDFGDVNACSKWGACEPVRPHHIQHWPILPVRTACSRRELNHRIAAFPFLRWCCGDGQQKYSPDVASTFTWLHNIGKSHDTLLETEPTKPTSRLHHAGSIIFQSNVIESCCCVYSCRRAAMCFSRYSIPQHASWLAGLER